MNNEIRRAEIESSDDDFERIIDLIDRYISSRLGVALGIDRSPKAYAELQDIGMSRVLIVAEQMLSRGESNLRFLGAEMLMREEPQRYRALVLSLLHDPEANVRGGVCELLGIDGHVTVLLPLVDVLRNDSDPEVRLDAATALGKCGTSLVLPALQWAVTYDRGTDWEGRTVADEARWAMSLIQHREVILAQE